MADIKFTGWINEIRVLPQGTVIEVAEKHRRKNDATGEWENTGEATYYDVWVDRAQYDPEELRESNLVRIEGSFKTKVTEKDGRKFYRNVINARTLESVSRDGGPVSAAWAAGAPASAAESPQAAVWSDDTPF